MPMNIPEIFRAGGFEIIEADGHDFQSLWHALKKAHEVKGKPILIMGHTIMGKGVESMEPEGKNFKSTWHGQAPKPEDADKELEKLTLSSEEKKLISDFLPLIKWKPENKESPKNLTKLEINTGTPLLYEKEVVTDCRSAYGKALVDLAKLNPEILGLTADLRSSVKTDYLNDHFPDRHIECGIAEQHMVSAAGGLSLKGFIPFTSTFGAFLSSRAKDQARVNDINRTNVKMVATHCGLSVGEDGPTHQAIDDLTSFLGMFNTHVIEAIDPNHTDRVIRYIASHYGNFYIRMGRHKFPIITKQDGTPYYDQNYKYEYGKTDLIREGNDLTIAASGPMVYNALQALQQIKTNNPNISIELIAISSIKKFDQTILNSIKKTKKLLTIEDHNAISGLSSQISKFIIENDFKPEKFESLAVKEYQLSGTSQELYKHVGLDIESIAKKSLEMYK